MKAIKNADNIINYEITCNEAAVTLLFVHDVFADETYWKTQVNYFSKHFKVVTIDLTGHGKSGQNREHWSLKRFSEDVIAVIKELKLRNIILIGHYLGSDINLLVAAECPKLITGFIAIESFKNVAAPLTLPHQHQAYCMMQNLQSDFENSMEAYATKNLFTPQTDTNIVTRVIKDYRNACPNMAISIMEEVFTITQTQKKTLPKLKFKLYLINVNYQPTYEVSLKLFANLGYEHQELHGTCHYPMLEIPAQLNLLLEQNISHILLSKRVLQ